MKVAVMELLFDDLPMEGMVAAALEHIDAGKQCCVITPNAEIGLACKKDPALARIVNESELVLPDGISIKLAAKILGAPITRKTAGIDFAQELCAALAKRGGGVYLFGAKPGVADAAGENLRAKYPGLCISGTHDGYFMPEEEERIAQEIDASDASAVFVCLGFPKQELYMEKYKAQLGTKIIAGLGGSLDIFAGTLKRAPDIWIKLGAEWLYRLICEPKRIKRMIKLPKYLWFAFVRRLKGVEKND